MHLVSQHTDEILLQFIYNFWRYFWYDFLWKLEGKMGNSSEFGWI